MQPDLPIYTIPGLGMKPGIFDHLRLTHGPLQHLQWIEPSDHGETFDHYCLRLSEQIDHHDPIILIGMSFGGLVAQRLARMLPVKKLVLISTIKTSDEKPHWLRLMHQLPLYRIQSTWGRNRSMNYWAPRFGIDRQSDIDFCRPMFNAHSNAYFRWAVHQIVHWENEAYPPNTLHIQGDEDLIFPDQYLGDHVSIPGGDHFMIYKRADEISRVINEFLNPETDLPSSQLAIRAHKKS